MAKLVGIFGLTLPVSPEEAARLRHAHLRAQAAKWPPCFATRQGRSAAESEPSYESCLAWVQANPLAYEIKRHYVATSTKIVGAVGIPVRAKF